jgi:ABC-2 type transport system ATP-binding protein
MDAILKEQLPEALMAIKVDPAVDALHCIGVGKRFSASMGKKEKAELPPPANRMAALWRRLRPPRRIKHAVDNVSLKLRRGEIFGVVGHNGSGKSTLIRMISTLLTPDYGSISVFGYDPQVNPYAVQRLINRVSVDAAFFKKLSANENLLYAARLYGVDDAYALKRAQEILEILGLEEGRMTDSLQELSRGMQQKVAVARALLTSPILLLLDEPTTGLDPKSKRDVQDFILELQRTHDATVLLTSHDMDEVERLCGRIALMSDGRFVARGSATELKQQVLARRIERGEARNGDPLPDMEEVFIELTGQEWLSAEEDVE